MIRPALLILAIVFVAAILAILKATTPSYATLTGPIRTAGRQAEMVEGTTFGVKVNHVVGARTIAYDKFGRNAELQSSGVWVVIAAELQALQQTMPVRAATLVGASGRLYRQSRRPDGAPNLLSMKVVQPGLTTTGIFVFELPEDETQNMELVVSEQYDPQLKDEIRVSLEQDAALPRDRLEIGKNGI